VNANDTKSNPSSASDSIDLIQSYIITLNLDNNPTFVDDNVIGAIETFQDISVRKKADESQELIINKDQKTSRALLNAVLSSQKG